MAKKRLNKKLLVILLVIGVVLLGIFSIAVDKKRPFLPRFVHRLLGYDPEKLFEESQRIAEVLEEL